MLLLLILVAQTFAFNSDLVEITLENNENVRQLKADVLELVVELPVGTILQIDRAASPVFIPYRTSSGAVSRSTNGFVPEVQILSVLEEFEQDFPQDKIDQFNATPGGLYITSLVRNQLDVDSGRVVALDDSPPPDQRFLKHYLPTGQRRTRQFVDDHIQRFGQDFNRRIDLASLPDFEQQKWTKIYQELRSFADRTVESSRRPLFLDTGSRQNDVSLARRLSEEFEQTGKIPQRGAWSVAVLGTAPRHGFGNVPCAEFMSEVIRQAYTKAGYKMSDDFKGKHYLLWKNTAAVVHLTTAMHQSGWIPWDPTHYKPPTGAIMMHAQATWPGHAYIIAGNDGRFIVDNGSPLGRDLHLTSRGHSKDIIEMMYIHGVFFLPPGIVPNSW